MPLLLPSRTPPPLLLILSFLCLTTPHTAPRQRAVFANKIAKNGVSSMLPLQITGVSVQDGQLVANATLGSHAFSIPLTLSTSPSAGEGLVAAATTDILHLQLG